MEPCPLGSTWVGTDGLTKCAMISPAQELMDPNEVIEAP